MSINTDSEKEIGCKVTIISFGILSPAGSGGGFISWHLAHRLHERGYLDKVIIFNKGKLKTAFTSVEPIPFTKYYLLLRRIMSKAMHIPYHIIRGIDERLCDALSCSLVDGAATTYVLTHPVFPRTVRKLKNNGVTTVLLAPNPFDLYIRDLITEEQKAFSIHRNDPYTSPFRIREMEKSYDYFDYIISLSPVVSSTYSEYGYGNKLIDLKALLGLNHDESCSGQKDKNVFRVCYLAHTVLLKGLQYLLEAWKMLNFNDAELIIGGNIDDSVRIIISRHYENLRNVKYVGNVTDTTKYFSQMSLFVCPSLIDAYPRTVFEAMACGLPVIITEGCGAKGVVEDSREGFVVPIRDANALKEKIMWLKEHPDEIDRMGSNAKEKIKNYSVRRFVDEVTDILLSISENSKI